MKNTMLRYGGIWALTEWHLVPQIFIYFSCFHFYQLSGVRILVLSSLLDYYAANVRRAFVYLFLQLVYFSLCPGVGLGFRPDGRTSGNLLVSVHC